MPEFQSSVNAPSPASYAVPLVDFAPLGNLPEKYYKGQAAEREEEKAQLFRNGIPKTAAGEPDYNAMAEQLYKRGDFTTGTALANTGLTQEGVRAGNDYAAGKYEPGATAPAVSRAPQTSVGDSPTSLVSALGRAGVPEDKVGMLLPRLAAALGVNDPNAPLDPGQTQKLQVILGRLAPQAPPAPAAGAPAQPAAPPAAPPAVPTSGVPRAAPQVAGGPTAAPTAGPTAAPTPAKEPVDPETGLPLQPPPTPEFSPPPGSGRPLTEDMAKDPRYIQAQDLFRRAAKSNLPATTAANMKARAEALMKTVEEAYKETPDQKNARSANMPLLDYQAHTETVKAHATNEAKLRSEQYGNIRELSEKAGTELPQLAFIRKQMDTDPNFYSGFGTKYVSAWKQMTAGVARLFPDLGLDPNAAFSIEAFGKVVSGNILNSLGLLKGLGPIRVAEMNLAKESSASANYTPQTNKFLLDLSMKLHQRSQWIAEAAANYKNGRLDPGFDKIVAAFDKKNGITEMLSKYQTVLKEAQPQKFATPEAVMQAVQDGKLSVGGKFLDADGNPRTFTGGP